MEAEQQQPASPQLRLAAHHGHPAAVTRRIAVDHRRGSVSRRTEVGERTIEHQDAATITVPGHVVDRIMAQCLVAADPRAVMVRTQRDFPFQTEAAARVLRLVPQDHRLLQQIQARGAGGGEADAATVAGVVVGDGHHAGAELARTAHVDAATVTIEDLVATGDDQSLQRDLVAAAGDSDDAVGAATIAAEGGQSGGGGCGAIDVAAAQGQFAPDDLDRLGRIAALPDADFMHAARRQRVDRALHRAVGAAGFVADREDRRIGMRAQSQHADKYRKAAAQPEDPCHVIAPSVTACCRHFGRTRV